MIAVIYGLHSVRLSAATVHSSNLPLNRICVHFVHMAKKNLFINKIKETKKNNNIIRDNDIHGARSNSPLMRLMFDLKFKNIKAGDIK